jgi:hypothetical protein
MTVPFPITIPSLQQFWDRPIPKDQGDSTIGPNIYQSVGMALSQWEAVEGAFAMLFSVLLHSEYAVAGRVYGTAMSSNTRRQMLWAAWEVRCATKQISPEDQEAWKHLIDHYAAGGGRRNDIAHGIVTQFAVGGKDCGLFLAPPSYNSTRMEMPMLAVRTGEGIDVFGHKYRYTIADIGHFAQKFSELRHWTLNFVSGYASKHNG